MQRKLVIAFMSAAVGAAVASFAGVLLAGDEPPVVPGKDARRYALVQSSPEAQPDTKSPNWKSFSDDVGMLIRRDERLGLRARLYVRGVDGLWSPVATDTVGDLAGTIPVR